MPKSKSTKKKPKKRGPKLMGAEKRVRTTLTFDKEVLKHAKPHAKRLGISLSCWLEELMKPHLQEWASRSILKKAEAILKISSVNSSRL